MVEISIRIDQSAIFSQVQTFERGLDDAQRFAKDQIVNAIRYRVFDDFVRLLCARAGPGWTNVYTDHLIAVMKLNIPIHSTVGRGILTVDYNLDDLGDYDDLLKGAHHRAMEAIEPGTYGVTKGGKNRYNRHPPLVQLPYEGQDLENDKERRQEFWEQVVVGRDMEFELGMLKGKVPLTAADLGYIPTYEQVAYARVTEAWIPTGKAPQWLWLENGFNQSEPRINSVDFSRSLDLVTDCIADKIFSGAMLTLVELANNQGALVNAAGQPYVLTPQGARYTPYKEVLDLRVGDYTSCFGSI